MSAELNASTMGHGRTEDHPRTSQAEPRESARTGQSARYRNEGTAVQLRVKGRRRRYLDSHPEYFDSADREIADPLLYYRLVGRFMTAEERQEQVRTRGFEDALEASIVRSDVESYAIGSPDTQEPILHPLIGEATTEHVLTHYEVETKEEGWELWKEQVTMYFIHGQDRDFDYSTVDQNDEYDRETDDLERLEAYLNDEGATVASGSVLQGETGIQDF